VDRDSTLLATRAYTPPLSPNSEAVVRYRQGAAAYLLPYFKRSGNWIEPSPEPLNVVPTKDGLTGRVEEWALEGQGAAKEETRRLRARRRA